MYMYMYRSVEIAFPLADLALNETHITLPPRTGDRWRINFSRVEWHVTVVGDHYEKVGNGVLLGCDVSDVM